MGLKKNVNKRTRLIVFPGPASDPKTQLSLVYARLGQIQTMKVEFAVLPSAVIYHSRTRMGEILLEESKLIRQAEQLQAELKTACAAGSPAAVIDFSSRKRI